MISIKARKESELEMRWRPVLEICQPKDRCPRLMINWISTASTLSGLNH